MNDQPPKKPVLHLLPAILTGTAALIASLTAVLGTAIIFTGAYLLEKDDAVACHEPQLDRPSTVQNS